MKLLLCGLLMLSVFVAEPLSAGDIQVEVLAQQDKSWNGMQLPPYPEGEPELSILRISIPPGSELPMHLHPVINAGILLQGSLTVVTENGDRLHLQAGDPIIEVVDEWHYGKNEGDQTAVIVVFYAGVRDKPLTVEK